MSLYFRLFLFAITSFSFITIKGQEVCTFENCKTEIEVLLDNNLEKAFLLTEKLEKSALDRGDSLDLLEAYNYFAVIHGEKNQSYKALEFHNKSLQLKQKYASTQSVSNSLNLMGNIHHKNGNIDEALEFYLQAISVLNDSVNKYQISPRINICKLYLDLGELDKAKKELDKTYTYLKTINDSSDIASLDNLKGIYFLSKEELDSAQFYYSKNLVYNSQKKDSSKLANSYNNLAIVYYYKNLLNKSYLNFHKAYKIRKQIKDTNAILESIYNLGDFQQKLNNNDSAITYISEGLILAEEINSNINTRDFYHMLGIIYEKKRESNLALLNYKKYIEYHEKVTQKKNETRITELEAEYNFYQQKKELNKVKENNEFLASANIKINKLNTALSIFVLLLLGSIIIILKTLFENKKLARNLKKTTISKTEKETLIKEIHHRVKNNLQIIISLLRLQASTIDDKKTVEHFTECEQRIAAMALVHERLYKSSNYSEIDLPIYIAELTSNLITSLSSIRTRKVINIDVERLNLDTIIPISLIINECITNSFKHGYTEGKNDFEITCNFTKMPNNTALLFIGDNGVGFPEGFTLENPDSSLGVELIDSLVDQINGEIEIIRAENGAYYKITFPL